MSETTYVPMLVRWPADLKKQLHILAAYEGTSAAEYVRMLVREKWEGRKDAA